LKEDRRALDANLGTFQMCLIHKDFKHFPASNPKDFRLRRKVSSIMRAKLLSIMRTNAVRVTPD
jgi:hypothetical protein